MKGMGTKPMEGQSNMMEYVIMTFFIFVVIVALILFLYNWQVSQSSLDSAIEFSERAVDMAGSVMNSLYFTKGTTMVVDPMLDDSKLMALNATEGVCDMLENVFGSGWFVEVRLIGDEGAEEVDCTSGNYPDCNKWSLCAQPDRESAYFNLPVNVYRKVAERTDIGIMTVGVYSE